MAKANTKIGDIFFVMLDNGNKKYFQYIANDLTQLNSDVIRSFKKEYLKNEPIDYYSILSGEIDFHAHTMINVGVKQSLFNKEGCFDAFPDTTNIVFRGTNDYGSKIGEEPIKVSEKWHVWHINDDNFTCVGKLIGENRKAEIGVVMPPFDVVERIKTGKFNFVYPNFE